MITDDLISRQAAIDALREIEFSHYMEFGEDIREVRLIRAEKAQDTIEQLPSAQPEIIRCKDCIWWRNEDCSNPVGMFLPEEDDYCSCATRRKENG